MMRSRFLNKPERVVIAPGTKVRVRGEEGAEAVGRVLGSVEWVPDGKPRTVVRYPIEGGGAYVSVPTADLEVVP